MNYRLLCEELDCEPEVEQFYDMVTGELYSWVYLPNGEIIRLVDESNDECDEIVSQVNAA